MAIEIMTGAREEGMWCSSVIVGEWMGWTRNFNPEVNVDLF